MKILSLFDGISCARVALERVCIPIEQYYASEIDKYAIVIAQKNYPDTFQMGDVKEIGHHAWYPPNGIDLLVGGSPCQDLSIAKKNRKGLSGERSGLFWEYVRILKELKPKYFILENVASMPKEAKVMITETLGVEPIMINAALVSAQNRKRLFWTNIPNVTQPEDKGILLKDILENGEADRLKSYCIDASYYKGANWKQYKEKGRRQLIKVGHFNQGGQADGVYSPEGKSTALSALGGGGGAKTGLYAVPVALRNRGQGKKPEYNGTGKANAMTSVQTDSMVAIIQTPRGFNKGGVKSTNGKTPTLSSSSWEHNNKLTDGSIIRKLTPIECERLQGLDDDYTVGISNTQRYKCLGNAFNVDVVAHILSFIPRK